MFTARYQLTLQLRCRHNLSLPRPGFDSSLVHVRFMVDAVALKQVFLRLLRFFSCQHRFINVSHSSLVTTSSYHNSKRAKCRNLPKKQCSFGMREHGIEKYLVFKGIQKEDAVVITGIIRSRTGNQWWTSL
jgi:hypothetical protein